MLLTLYVSDKLIVDDCVQVVAEFVRLLNCRKRVYFLAPHHFTVNKTHKILLLMILRSSS